MLDMITRKHGSRHGTIFAMVDRLVLVNGLPASPLCQADVRHLIYYLI
jgi:hypothetical protein